MFDGGVVVDGGGGGGLWLLGLHCVRVCVQKKHKREIEKKKKTTEFDVRAVQSHTESNLNG